MKKYLNIVAVMLIVLTMTACGEKKETKPLDILKATIENTKEIKNIGVKTKADIKIVSEGMTVESPITVDVKLATSNETTGKGIISISENPIIGEQTAYFDYSEKMLKAYFNSSLMSLFMESEITDNEWLKIETSLEETSEEEEPIIDSTEIDKIKNIKVEDIIKDEDFVFIDKENDVNHYQLKITEELIKRLGTALEEDVTDVEMDGTLVIDMYINTKENRIVKVSTDLGEFVKKQNVESFDTSDIQKFVLTVELSYDNITVNIPNNVINDSITFEEYSQNLMEG